MTSTAVYRCGTLEYTKRALMIVFLWLLWGDFCFTLMETIEPTVLPFMLKGLGASNLIISMYITTITNVFNLTICPISSFMSDRYRSKWGRRIPFLAFATPFVALFLVLTGFCREIGRFLFTHFFHHTASSEAAFTIGLIAVFVVGYQFFNMIIASVYYYLFNDVVPEQFIGRFMAYFRAVGTGAGALFNFFVLRYAQTHSKEIFVGFAVLYFIGFMMMCWRVREGQYPDPPKMAPGRNTAISGVITFFRESYCHKFYWYFYLSFGFWTVQSAIGPFGMFRTLNIGLSMKEIGFLGGLSLLLTTLLLIPAGYYVDKKHPIRVGLTTMIWCLAFLPLNAIFLWPMNHKTAYVLTIITTLVTLPVGAVFAASELPMFMRLLPHSRYGQFCSANSLIRSAMMIAAGVLCGLFVDYLKVFCQGTLHMKGDYYYRLIFIWQIVFVAIAVYFRVKLYKLWLQLGGDDNYLPPVFEKDEIALREAKQDQQTAAPVGH